MQVAEGELIAFIDDDCTVEPTWLQTVADVFSSHLDVSLVFGRVLSSESPSANRFMPVYDFANERRLRGPLAMLHTGCMAASMYMRPNLWHTVGPVDACTGAGAPFACEDRDYCYRVLKDGHVVLETPEISVIHHGARPYFGGAASRLIRRDAYSFGALHMKALRCGDPAAIVLIAVELWRNLRRIKLMRILRGDRQTGLAWMPMYLSGLVAGLRRPLDRRRRLWR
jgi:GT2 family glycosyltransferase